MNIVYFTLVAVFLYLLSDRILQQIEKYYGKRFEQRELIFFFILAILSIAGFTLIRSLNPI